MLVWFVVEHMRKREGVALSMGCEGGGDVCCFDVGLVWCLATSQVTVQRKRYGYTSLQHAMDQTEKAFQKQDAVFIGSKRLLGKKSKKTARYWRNVGLSFQTPKEAKELRYVDKKCPFTGNVSIRGRILKGMCISHKMKNTVIIRRNYLHYIKKYHRFEKRHKNVAAHCSPCFDVKDGDILTVGQCRPLAKTVRFNVVKCEKNQIFGAARKQFQLF